MFAAGVKFTSRRFFDPAGKICVAAAFQPVSPARSAPRLDINVYAPVACAGQVKASLALVLDSEA